MIVYLTSSIGGTFKANGRRYPKMLDSSNGLIQNLKKHWNNDMKSLFITANPTYYAENDGVRDMLMISFAMSGLSVRKMDICDDRNRKILDEINNYNVIILSGGHVPTQNKFFQKIKLKEKIKDYEGILIGISAGTMNSADIVYAQPELEGESVDKNYKRFLQGLGLTDLMILPHYQELKDDMLDGKRLFEEITYPDSYGREFYAIVDGSYIVIEENVSILYGEGYLIQDGQIEQICKKNETITIK